MDRTGAIVIEARFEDAGDFRDGLAPVNVHSDETTWCPRDSSGSRKGFTNKWGFIDKSGQLVIAPQYESAEAFSEGLAAINQCDRTFFIDRTGKKIVLGEFNYASSFRGGLSRVDVETKDGWVWGYIDRGGQMVWGPVKRK
jgi:hypothetical protein